MAEIYKICSGATGIEYTITLTGPAFSCTAYCEEWNQNGYEYKRCTSDYILTSDKVIPASETLTVQLKNDLDICFFVQPDNGCTNSQQAVEYFNIDINANTNHTDFQTICFYQYYTPGPYDQPGRSLTRTNVELLVQGSVPDCTPPLPECTLAITGTTISDPSSRGISDAYIIASISGQTGTTITWKINNVVDAGTGVIHTFTGLTSGTYIIRCDESLCYSTQTLVVGEGEFRTGDFTVIDPVSNIVATENPILINIGTAINSFSPIQSVSTFNITGNIANVVIDFALIFPYSYNAEFRSKGYPDRANYFLESQLKDQVGNVVGNNSTTDIATSLAESLQKDPIISRIYYISSSGTTVTLKAKGYGSDYNLDSSNVTITGSNITLANPISGIAQYDGQLTPNYSLYTELFVDNGIGYGDIPDVNEYRRVAELELPFSNDNNHQFNLSQTLKNFVSSPKISFVFTGVTYLGGMIVSYFIKYGEKYPLVENSNTKKKRYKGQTGYGWCINSSLPFETDNSMDVYFGQTGATGQHDVLFFNTAGNTKYSHRDSKEFMSIIVSQDYMNALRVFGNIYLYDGTIYTDINLFDIKLSGTTTNYGGMAVLSVGYDDLGLSSYESSSKIRKIDINVKQLYGGFWIPYSETRSYLFEIDEQPANYNIAFLNSLGTYETYTFTGEVVEGEEILRQSYQKPYPINSKGAASIGFQYNSTIDTEYTKTFVVNSGIIDEEAFYFLQGMLQSNRIYHYDDIHQNYLNVLGQTSTKSSNTNEYSVQVTFKETISENNVNQ